MSESFALNVLGRWLEDCHNNTVTHAKCTICMFLRVFSYIFVGFASNYTFE